MPDKPILFTASNVRAILDGRKVQTRRVLKPPPAVSRWAAGDTLWVRETYATIDNTSFGGTKYYQYRADTDGKCLPGDWPDEEKDNPDRPRWRSPRWMPRVASRITLEVTDVRVERVQAITEEDALAEGIVPRGGGFGVYGDDTIWDSAPELAFFALWNSIHKDDGPHGWFANPWVAALTFKMVEKKLNPMNDKNQTISPPTEDQVAQALCLADCVRVGFAACTWDGIDRCDDAPSETIRERARAAIARWSR